MSDNLPASKAKIHLHKMSDICGDGAWNGMRHLNDMPICHSDSEFARSSCQSVHHFHESTIQSGSFTVSERTEIVPSSRRFPRVCGQLKIFLRGETLRGRCATVTADETWLSKASVTKCFGVDL